MRITRKNIKHKRNNKMKKTMKVHKRHSINKNSKNKNKNKKTKRGGGLILSRPSPEYEEREIKSEYNYLLNLSVYNFTSEKVDELQAEIDKNKEDYEGLKDIDPKDIWRNELDVFEEKYNEWLKNKK